MDFILDILTEERICQKVVCKNRETWTPQKMTASYNNIMSLGAGIVRPPAAMMAGALSGGHRRYREGKQAVARIS